MFDYRARCAVAVTTEITREAQRRHGLDPVTTIAVGRAITCAALLASTLKEGNEYVHCSFNGKGVLQKVIGECNGDGHCRGYAAPARLLDMLGEGQAVPESVGEAMGHAGVLTVTRGKAGEMHPYTAVINFLNGEIASDVARFLTESEQVPSAVAAGVKLGPDGAVLGAGGVLVQRLGGADLDERALADLETRLRDELHVSERRALSFACSCSREKMASALFALGEAEVRKIQAEQGKLEVRCQYCATAHTFRVEELLTH
jgi:molecular chaperone Hsp33